MPAWYEFKVILAGVDTITEKMVNDLFEAGCDDATPASSEGIVTLDFDRHANDLADAVGSALDDIASAGYRVKRIEIGDAVRPSPLSPG